MSGLLNRCKDLFKTENLYEVLGVEKDASKKELKKGYYKKSLAHHPDRAAPEEKTNATHRFQVLSQVHCLLSDDGRRAEYDETGYIDEEMSVDQDWDKYWRLLYPKVTVKDIQEFSDKYKGSEEELVDLKRTYVEVEGDMDRIMEQMLCCDFEDEPRFRSILQDLIDKEELPNFDSFSKETDKKKKARSNRARKEAKEAEEEAKKLRLGDDESSLTALIAQRQASRAGQAEDFFAQLEAKYAQGGGVKGSKKKGAKKTGR